MKKQEADIQYLESRNLKYLLHVPAQAAKQPRKLWPTILFLHGYGESGDDLSALFEQGLPATIEDKAEFPFIVIAPQCPWLTWWPELARSIEALLDQCTADLPIDPKRLYLTGLSMGGYGTWYLGTLWPQKFAAVAPICGGGYWFHGFPERVLRLKNTPVWAFHGAKDDVVHVSETEQLVELLEANGGDVTCTVYPEADHDSWTATYDNEALYEWLLQHSLAD